MEHQLEKMPSFKSLTVVSAVVRHQSFTTASHELHVTPSAVSKQIAQIESFLGMTLFDRHGGAVLPRPEALQLAKSIDAAKALLLEAVSTIRPAPARGVLRVAAPATFAMRWLIPRLWTFSSRYPAVAVDVIQTHASDDLTSIDYDVAIRQSAACPPDARPRPVLTDALGLVMSPALLRSRRAGSVDLSRVMFLESDSRPGELDRWLDLSDTIAPLQRRRRRFPHFYIALEAAVSGEGALVAPVFTIADLIERSLLTEPFKGRRISAGHMVAFAPPGQSTTSNATAFLDWIEASGSRCGHPSGRASCSRSSQA
ncbi:LysR substrate-binding domain-containing protein [Yoonia vestfoldensis]|uniref:LysR substrate-binding domain-containing protein n=1 Tax=Yoonia vestfoldensis TaxID=245188 RepID=UPI000375A1CC|nr:LysR substrate-binding domain-containing protein [Yoonia vestfoldensis]